MKSKIHLQNVYQVKAFKSDQKGVVLLFALIALVVMLIASVALVRSFNSTLFNAGNIAFKRDLQNQAERAVSVALNQVRTGGSLVTPDNRAKSNFLANYSAKELPTNAQGIPTDLLMEETDFRKRWTAAPVAVPDSQQVKVYYVVDRLCDNEGLDNLLGSGHCQLVDAGPTGGSGSDLNVAENSSAAGAGALALQIVYRISIRVDGPRDTQAFFQTTFTL